MVLRTAGWRVEKENSSARRPSAIQSHKGLEGPLQAQNDGSGCPDRGEPNESLRCPSAAGQQTDPP